MAGIKFLNLKSWHPSNARNQKRIWIAEQQAKEKEQRERDAARDVRKAQEQLRFQALAAAKGDASASVEKLQVGFLYAPPPGLQKADGNTEVVDATEDDAVREFRRKVERRSGKNEGGTGEAQRPLERYVGRRPDEPLTIKEQVERFPFLKDAPVEGDYTSSVKVNFKPMGMVIRNVRCLRCGEWGHASGDRECRLKDQNPLDSARQAREDPMTLIRSEKRQQLVLKRSMLPLEMQGNVDGKPEFEILLSDDDEEDPEKKFLANLSSKEKRSLLKKLRKQATQKKRHRVASSSSDSSSSSSCSSSSSSDSSDDRGRERRSYRRSSGKRKRQHRENKTKSLVHRDDIKDTSIITSRRRQHSRSRSRSLNRRRTHSDERGRSSRTSRGQTQHRDETKHARLY